MSLENALSWPLGGASWAPVLEPDFSCRQRFNCWRLGGLLLEDWALALAASLTSSTLIPATGKPSIQREKGPTSQLGLV